MNCTDIDYTENCIDISNKECSTEERISVRVLVPVLKRNECNHQNIINVAMGR